MNSAAEQIKRSVDMRAVLVKYGFEVNRSGFMPCPFHREKQASMKIYDQSFYCFGCGAGSSVIDFVMRLFDIDFRQAVVRMSNDFHLNLTHEKPDPGEIKRKKEDLRRKRLEEMEQKIIYRKNESEFRRLLFAKLYKAPQKSGDAWDEEYCEALRKLPYLEYWFDEMQGKAR